MSTPAPTPPEPEAFDESVDRGTDPDASRGDATREGDQAFDRRLLAPMMLGAILNPINSSIIAVALVPIGHAFDAPPSQTAWLISGLYLATAVGQPVVGGMVDRFGPKRLFLAGAALTGIAGVIGTFAPQLWVLIIARVILGFGTCAGYPAAMYLIRSEAARTKMASPAGVLTLLSVATQTIAVIGPTLGGLLIGATGWRGTMAINIPLALASLLLGAAILPARTALESQLETGSGARPTTADRLDLLGMAGFSVTLLCLLLFLQDAQPSRLWLLGVTAVAGAGFAWWELHRPASATDPPGESFAAPFIDLRLLGGNLPLILTYIRALAASTVSYSFLYGFTPWLEESRGLSASMSGLILMPSFAVGIAVSLLTGPRPEVRAKLLVGAVAQVAVAVMLLLLHADSAIPLLIAVAVVLGLPQGLVSLGNQNALYAQARPDKIGNSAGLLRTFQYLGAILASSATGIFFGSHARDTGLHQLGLLMAAAAVAFLVLTLADRSLRAVGRDRAEELPEQ